MASHDPAQRHNGRARGGSDGWRPTTLQESILRLYGENLSADAIADKLGTTPAAVYSQITRLRRYGYDLPVRPSPRGGGAIANAARRLRQLKMVAEGNGQALNPKIRSGLTRADLVKVEPNGAILLTAHGRRTLRLAASMGEIPPVVRPAKSPRDLSDVKAVFAANLRQLRTSLYLPQSGFAPAITPAQISGYETGRSLPSLSNLLHLADVLDVSPAALLKGL